MPSPILAFRDIPSGAILLDARGSDADYAAGHLPNAWHAQPDRTLSSAREPGADPARGGRHPLPSLETWRRTLGNWGIGPDTDVVIYDDQSGANAAARAWWMLRAIGHELAFVLDGGLPHDAALTTELPSIAAREPYPATEWISPTVGVAAVDSLRNDAAWKVLDVRSAPRYRGETEPIDPIAGHIPGAVNLPFTENLRDGRFRNADELREQYEALLGDVPADRLIVHCGSGITACHTLLALEMAGLSGASLYVGSWSEWCRNEELPRATVAPGATRG